MKLKQFLSFIGLALFVISIESCDKTAPYDVATAPALAHFLGSTNRVYILSSSQTSASVVKVGTTDVASVDRNVAYTITSPSGAVIGTNYTVNNAGGNNGTITFPAGNTIENLQIQGIYTSGYATGRIDTLIITLSTPGMNVGFNSVLTMIIKDCKENNILNINDLLGQFTTTDPYFGTYITEVSSVAITSQTSARIKIKNLCNAQPSDVGPWGAVICDLDWSNPAQKTATILEGAVPNSDASYVFGSNYTGYPVAIVQGGSNGTWSYCNQSIRLVVNLGAWDNATSSPLGYDPTDLDITLER